MVAVLSAVFGSSVSDATVAMLVIEVPFGKWAHLMYRPLAVYLQAVKERAVKQEVPTEAVLENA